MNWTVQCAEYHLYRGVSRTNAYTNAYEFTQPGGAGTKRRLAKIFAVLSKTSRIRD